MKVLLMLSAVFLLVVPVLAQNPRSGSLQQMYLYNPLSVLVLDSDESVITLDPYEVYGKRESSDNIERLTRELNNQFYFPRNTVSVEIVPDHSLLSQVTEENPVVGRFTGIADDLRRLNGGIRMNLGGSTTTLYIKSGVRWHLQDDPNTMIIIRASRLTSIAVEYKFVNGSDFLKPIEMIFGKFFD